MGTVQMNLAAAAEATLSPLQQKVLSAPLQKPYKWFASTDPQKSNHDYLQLKPGEKRIIPLAAGALERVWCTASIPDQISITLNNGKPIPLLRDHKAQIGQFFQKAYTLYPQSAANSPAKTLVSSAALEVVNHSKEPNKFFYQVTVRPLPASASPQYSGQENIISAQKKLESGAALTVGNPGQLRSGIIRQIRINSPDTPELPVQDLLLQIAIGADKPLVQIPLSAFVGAFGPAPAGDNAMAQFDKKTLVINWPMPVGNAEKEELTFKIQNTGSSSVTLKVQLSFLEMDQPSAFYFCARLGSGNSVQGQPFSLITIDGAGALMGVGANMGPAPESPRRTFAFLEGNEIIYADNDTYEGTGTEDFFNSAWYFPSQTYSHPYDGVSFHSASPPRVAASRWMIDDAVPFTKQLRITLEHGNGNRGTDLQYHWYVFWYQQQPIRFEVPEIARAAHDATTAPNENAASDSPLAAVIRVLIYTALFVAMIFIVLTALAKYGQRK